MTYFRVDPEHLVSHRPADTYDVVHADNHEVVIANVTHQQATFIASVLNGRTEADIQAEALREAAADMRRHKDGPSWNLRHPSEDETWCSPDVWLEELADQLAVGRNNAPTRTGNRR